MNPEAAIDDSSARRTQALVVPQLLGSRERTHRRDGAWAKVIVAIEGDPRRWGFVQRAELCETTRSSGQLGKVLLLRPPQPRWVPYRYEEFKL